MAYSELIKNFEKIREYMRGFYVYGFKNRNEYTQKSARSYDDERRRIESWLGDNIKFVMTPEGKNVFLSIDSRAYHHNPLFKAWKAKSFTDKDITLHFIIFDILHSPDIKMTLGELIEKIDTYIAKTESDMSFDESTVRKKLKEYIELGLILSEKNSKKVLYSRMSDTDISNLTDVLDFFSEAAPLGVVGSFLLDKIPIHEDVFSFKHHYITDTMDSGVLARIFDAISSKCYISVSNYNPRRRTNETLIVVPIKVFVSVQSGRQNLIAYNSGSERYISLRLDRLSEVKKLDEREDFDILRTRFLDIEKHMWGVNSKINTKHLVHVEFDVFVDEGESYIINRINREKRCGTVEQINDHTFRFIADVFDATEMIPWIRTFICRITRFECSEKQVEDTFKTDLLDMYKLYGIGRCEE